MTIKVLTFGQVADIINQPSFDMNDVADTNSLKLLLEEKYHQLREVRYAIAVDKKIIDGNTAIHDKSVVALLPPFSGG